MRNYTKDQLWELVNAMGVKVSFGKRMAGDVVFIECQVAELPLNALEHVLAYGVRQKVQDAGASDKTATDKRDSGIAIWERLMAGDVGRAKSDGVTDLQHEARLIAANLLRTKRPDEWNALKGAEKAKLNARLDEIVAKNAETINAQAQEKLDEKARERARLAKLSVEIDL